MTAPLIAISRHRLTVDGNGVTTLVCFHGCPLQCQYCLNSQCLDSQGVWKTVTPEELLDITRIDDLYFQATGGGICFGGGEPLLRSTFIRDFCERCPKEWNIYLESSLNVENRHLLTVAPFVTHYYIDVKDMAPDIYRHYTGQSPELMLSNLQWLVDQGQQDKVTIRLPLIPAFNADADRQRSRLQLEDLGFTDFDLFDYVIR